LLVLFVIMGFVAGLMNVVRAAQKAQADMAASLAATPSVADDDEDDR
jgi:ATP synthase protein I